MFLERVSMKMCLLRLKKFSKSNQTRLENILITWRGVKKRVLQTHNKCLKICNPNTIEKEVCVHANGIHAWNKLRTSFGKENWYRNHFILPDQMYEFFENLFNID